MHLTARVQRITAALVAALGAAVLGVAAGGMGGIERELQAAEAAAPPVVQTERVAHSPECDELYEWQKERRY